MKKYNNKLKKVEKESSSTQPLWSLATRIDKRHRMDSEDWVNNGKWVRVKSSNVREIRYEATTKRLWVKFKNVLGHYEQVPKKVAEAFFNSSSLGKFVWRRLRDRYTWIK